MSFHKKTVHDIDVDGKTVLVRADFNVPLHGGKITDDYRIKKAVPTLKLLIEKGAKLVLCSHLGRPDGHVDPRYSLKPVVPLLSKLLERQVRFADECIGEEADRQKAELGEGDVLLLENLRFHPEEEANDNDFARSLAQGCDYFVQDGFGVVHRAHASTDSVTRHLPSVAGLLIEKEVNTITEALENPGRPLVAIIGGAKISDKIDILDRLIDMADFVAVGGAMANTFLMAKGIDIGGSVSDKDNVPLAKEIMQKADDKSKRQRFVFYVPQDGVVANKTDKTAHTRIVDWDAHTVAAIEAYPKKPSLFSSRIKKDEMILDIGPVSASFIAGSVQLADTVIWNGALGVTETESLTGPIGPFSHGTQMLIDAILGDYGSKPFSVVGGGDTVGYIEQKMIVGGFGHVSTGGGASMELMSGKKLPGIEALMDK